MHRHKGRCIECDLDAILIYHPFITVTVVGMGMIAGQNMLRRALATQWKNGGFRSHQTSTHVNHSEPMQVPDDLGVEISHKELGFVIVPLSEFLERLENPTCPICFDDFRNEHDIGEIIYIMILQCEHTLHAECVLPWFEEKGTYPTCRATIHKTVTVSVLIDV